LHAEVRALGDVSKGRAPREVRHELAIVGVNRRDEVVERGRVDALSAPENAIQLLGPRDVAGAHVPGPRADVPDALGFDEQLFTLAEQVRSPEPLHGSCHVWHYALTLAEGGRLSIVAKLGTMDKRYAHVMGGLNHINTTGALAINVLTMVLVRHNRSSLIIVATAFFALAPINWWITTLLKKHPSTTVEPFRVALNMSVSLFTNHLVGWPVSNWLWLPFIALAFDGFSPRATWFILVVTCGANAALSLHDGVSWVYPTAAVVVALYARAVTETRLSIIREMFARSDAQRASLDEAHVSLKHAIEAQQRVEIELRHSQKLEAIGRLASGVAHEMNTPLQFVSDSIEFIGEGVDELLRLHKVNAGDARTNADTDFLCANLPSAMQMTRDGLGRVTSIVSSLKEFARGQESTKTRVDLNRSIETTLCVAKHEYKYVADVEVELGDLPQVTCHGGEINQVILNLVVNAAHAVADAKRGPNARGHITVRSVREGSSVVLSVSDDGAGIPERIRDRIFEPFFSTKEVGRGSGQGLAIARNIVVDRHQGALWFESTVGKGTTFYLRLPIDGLPMRRAA
jgi:signal transduction histidine kinase